MAGILRRLGISCPRKSHSAPKVSQKVTHTVLCIDPPLGKTRTEHTQRLSNRLIMRTTSKKQLASNLWLGLAVYYNTLFSVLYFIVGSYLLYYKVTEVYNLNYTQMFLLPFTWVLWCIAEVARTFFVYQGNLKERVPALSAFILFTMVQVASLLYLTFGQILVFPVEPALGCTALLFCILELLLSRSALFALIDQQTANFLRLQQQENEKND